jgi:hypothetical protein
MSCNLNHSNTYIRTHTNIPVHNSKNLYRFTRKLGIQIVNESLSSVYDFENGSLNVKFN